jgi:LPPG:FO 2-phospho-L-lactate transferase
MILALAGGVGGARLAHGLAMLLPPDELTIVVNTGDDFRHLGLHISPDPDTVLYTLSGLADRERGWGRQDESWNFMAALGALGGETWFQLGDKDLALHLERTRRLAEGETLSDIVADFARRMGIGPAIVPMSDDPAPTLIHTEDGVLSFQDYFVRRRCEPVARRVEFSGAGKTRPSPAFHAAMNAVALSGIVICPSNPVLSIDPILSVEGVRAWLQNRSVPCVAVSSLIGGKAVKGPAAKIMRELSLEAGVRGVARHFDGLVDTLVIDHQDAGEIAATPQLAIHATDALMVGETGRRRLADETLRLLATLPRR